MMERCVLCPGPVPVAWHAPSELIAAQAGAVASFLGVVRDHHHGRCVSQLRYVAHEPLALGVMRRLADDLRSVHGSDVRVLIAHGTGVVLPGQVAVAIHVSATHRRAALAACAEAIEALKRDLPVWKHETFCDGSSHWVEGS